MLELTVENKRVLINVGLGVVDIRILSNVEIKSGK